MVAALQTGDDRVRLALLRELEGRVPVELLLELLRDQDSEIRRMAAWFLRKHVIRAPVEPLLEALRDQNELVRLNALESLAELGKPVPLKALLALLQEREISSRVLSIVQQFQIALPVDVLLTMLHDERYGCFDRAAQMLAAMGADAPIAKLLEILHDPSSPAHSGAIQALTLLSDSVPVPLEPLAALLQKEDPASPVYSSLVFLLGRRGVCLPIEVLLNAIQTGRYLPKEQEAFLVTAVGNLGAQAPLEALLDLVDDEEYGNSQERALQILHSVSEWITPERLVSALHSRSEDEIAALQVLAALGKQAPIDLLRNILDDEKRDRWVRTSARRLLHDAGFPVPLKYLLASKVVAMSFQIMR